MKQLIILDSKNVIDKFLYFYKNNNNNIYNKMLINENIQKTGKHLKNGQKLQ